MKKYLYFFTAISILLTGCSSDDSGSGNNNSNATWENITFSGDDGYGIYSSCTDGVNLYFGTQTDGVYKSSDNGNTWTAINNGIIDTKYCNVFYLNNALYLTTKVICPICAPINKIYKSTNNGDSWTSIWDSAITYYIDNISGDTIEATIGNIQIIDNNIFLSFGKHLLKSSNNGQDWQLVFTNPNTFFPNGVKEVLKINNSLVLLIENEGVYKSTDSGNSFSSLNNINALFSSMAVSNSNLIFGTSTFSNTSGIYTTDESSTNWELNNQDFGFNEFTGLVRFSSIKTYNNIVYASCNNNAVFLSTNNGLNWQKLGSDIKENESSIADRNLIKINNSLFLITADELYKYNL